MPWYRRVAERGWIAPHWPREHGGMEASPVEQVILFEEMARAGAPDLPLQGINHLGPLLISAGTEAQRRTHLPRILSGQTVWCQGYSEPGAGSDLASLSTRGEVHGDTIVINGHKTWSTWAHHADCMFALVRSVQGSSGREGLTFVLVDLSTPGITRRPIRNIAGESEFCDVFFDDVAVPLENVVGSIGGGWSVATLLLDHERINIGSPIHALRAWSNLVRLSSVAGVLADSRVRDRVSEAEIALEALISTYLDALERLAEGQPASTASSVLKVLSTGTTQFILDVAQEMAGPLQAVKNRMVIDGVMADFSEMYLYGRCLSIFGGTNEIQRTLLAARVLGLPRGRR
jgi:alkylation response protein AidB-like acyl-CoA dehydrogenase